MPLSTRDIEFVRYLKSQGITDPSVIMARLKAVTPKGASLPPEAIQTAETPPEPTVVTPSSTQNSIFKAAPSTGSMAQAKRLGATDEQLQGEVDSFAATQPSAVEQPIQTGMKAAQLMAEGGDPELLPQDHKYQSPGEAFTEQRTAGKSRVESGLQKQSSADTFAGKAAGLAETIGGTIQETAGAVVAPAMAAIAPVVTPVGKGIKEVFDKFATTVHSAIPDEMKQKVVDWADSAKAGKVTLEENIPSDILDLGKQMGMTGLDFLNVVALLQTPGLKGAWEKTVSMAEKAPAAFGELATGVTDAVAGVPGAIKQGVSGVGTAASDAIGGSTKGLQAKATSIAENSIKKFWTSPTEKVSGFKDANAIYKKASEKGHDIGDTLVKNKLNPSDNIVEKKYNTLDSAEKLRDDAIQLSKDVLRPALQAADTTFEKVPTSTVMERVIKGVQENKYLLQEQKDALLQKLKTTSKALEKQYPEGMSLENLLDERILRDSNSKYNKLGDMATTQEAQKNRAVADALRDVLNESAPAEISVPDFQALLKKNFDAADYLDALHGKSVPQSMLQRGAETAAKAIGAGIGHGTGGGILGGVAGYRLGGIIENMITDLPSPLRAKFLKNLEVTNPEALTKIQNYLKSFTDESKMSQPMNIDKSIPTNKSVPQTQQKSIAPEAFTPKENTLATSVLNETIKSGGATIDIITNKMPKTGYPHSPYPELGVASDTLTPKEIIDFSRKNMKTLKEKGNKLGLWKNPKDGKFYYDVVKVEKDRQTAINIAKSHGEQAIYSYKDKADIRIDQDVNPRPKRVRGNDGGGTSKVVRPSVVKQPKEGSLKAFYND